MQYYFRHTDVIDHPQVLSGGYWAGAVFTAVCDVNASRDFSGHVPAAYLEPAWLARSMNLQAGDVPGGDPIAMVRHALSRCFVTGLLVKTETGAHIDGWDRRQPQAPMTAAQRKRKQREQDKLSRESRTVTPVTNVTTGEERRGEEIRKKPLREPPAAPSAAAEAFKLEPSPPEALPSKASEWEELRDRLDDARVRARPDCPDDPGFCAKREEANAVLRKSAAWLAEKFSVPLPDAKVLMRKAAWVYAADDWPGRQAGMTPWSLWVFVKRKHLGTYAGQAQGMTWVHDELEDLWHPSGWKP